MTPVAILCGGFGTRLARETETVPKSLVDVQGHPFIHYQLRLLAEQGLREVILLVGHRYQQIIDVVGAGDPWGLHVQYSITQHPIGTGDAVWRARDLLFAQSPDVLLMYGDSYLACDYHRLVATHDDSGKWLTVATCWDPARPDFALVEYGVSVVNHAFVRKPKQHWVDYVREGVVCNDVGIWIWPTPYHEIGSPAGLAAFRAMMGLHADR
jgi:NDP-sugar pyrophosphorylase family protein